jgi:hypothetical protein
MSKSRFWAAAAATACMALGAAAHAGVIYSDYGPGGSFDGGTGWTLGGPSSFLPQVVAAEFTTAGSYDVTEIDLSVGHILGADGATVSLWTSAAGSPATQLGSWSLSSLPNFGATTTSVISGVSGVHLAAGTSYFLEVNVDADALSAWNLSDQSAALPMSFNGGSAFSDTAPAFAVLGNVSGAVPEPGVWALLLTGFFGVGALLRNRRPSDALAA